MMPTVGPRRGMYPLTAAPMEMIRIPMMMYTEMMPTPPAIPPKIAFL